MMKRLEDVIRYLRFSYRSLRHVIMISSRIYRKYGIKTDIAVSSDRLVFLDMDDINDETLSFLRGICRGFRAHGIILRSPYQHGYHFILLKVLDKNRWNAFYNGIYDILNTNTGSKLTIDKVFVAMTIERGYTTLRLGHKTDYVAIINPDGSYKVYTDLSIDEFVDLVRTTFTSEVE